MYKNHAEELTVDTDAKTVYNQKKDKGGGALIWVLAAMLLALGLWHAAIYVRGAKRESEPLDAFDEVADAEDVAALLTMDGARTAQMPEDGDEWPEEAETDEANEAAREGLFSEAAARTLDGIDAVWIAGLGLVAAFWRLLAALAFGWNAEVCFQTEASLMQYTLVGSMVGVGAGFAVMRRMGADRTACVLGGVLLALNLSWSTMAGAWALLALVFCLRSMDEGRSRGGNLVAAAGFGAFAMYLDAAAALFLAGLWVIVLVEAASRLAQRKTGAKGAMVRAALVLPVATAVFYGVMLLPGALIGGATRQTLGLWLAAKVLLVFSAARPHLGKILASPDTIVCMGYGALCAILALWDFFRAARREAAIVSGLVCVSALALGLMGFSLAPAASVIAAGFVWARFASRGEKTQMWLAGGLLIAVELIMNVLRVAH